MTLLFNITFAYPIFLLLLPLMGFLLYLRLRKKYYAEVRLSSVSGFEGVKTLRTKLRPILLVLQSIALFSLIIALARPQSLLNKVNENADAIDIMLALDVSSSMLAKDFKEDRLEASKKVAQKFVEKRKFDRIGLVLFGRESFTQCPLTTDHKVVKEFLSMTQVGLIPYDGTAIGLGLANAVRRLQNSEAKSKVCILLSDGVNDSGSILPEDAAEAAKKYGVKVYAIGIGTIGKALFPVALNANGGFIYGERDVEIDEELLKSIAQKTGGKYFRATQMSSLEEIYSEIDKLEKTKIEKSTFRRYKEQFHWLVFLALISILLHLILSNTVFRTIVQ